MTKKYKWGMVAVLLLMMSLMGGAFWLIPNYDKLIEFQPCVVVEKIQVPANGSYLVGMDEPKGKTQNPRLVFKKNTTEPTFYVVCANKNGVEYNVRVDHITFTRVKLLDTLWTEK